MQNRTTGVDLPFRIKADSLTKHITFTLHLKGVKRLRARLWLAKQIVRFGAFVGGFGFKVEK